MSRPAIAEVDLQALLHNYRLAQEAAPDANTLAVVKANAYGHGALEVSRCLEPHVPALGVACIEEALALRADGIEKPILLLEGPFTQDEIETAASEGFWLMLENASQVQWVLDAEPSQALTIWLKLDTGMHRLEIGRAHV